MPKSKWKHSLEQWRYDRYVITCFGHLGYQAVYEQTPDGAYIEHLGNHDSFDIAKDACFSHKRKNAAHLRKLKKR